MKEEYKIDQVEQDAAMSPNILGVNAILKNEPDHYAKDVGPCKYPFTSEIENYKKGEIIRVSKLDEEQKICGTDNTGFTFNPMNI